MIFVKSFTIAIRMVHQVRESTTLPIIGMGGISSAKDVIEFILVILHKLGF